MVVAMRKITRICSQTDKNRELQHPIHTLVKMLTQAHALGVNVKVSTLQGPDDPHIHLLS